MILDIIIRNTIQLIPTFIGNRVQTNKKRIYSGTVKWLCIVVYYTFTKKNK